MFLKKLKLLFVSCLLMSFSGGVCLQAQSFSELGVWVSVFSSGNVLTSKEGADELLDFCSRHGIKNIYLQIFRSNYAYYDSDFLPGDTFDRISASFGKDPVKYIIRQAHLRDLEVHLWINALSLAQNESAHILKTHGEDVLTYDQYGRTPLIKEKDLLDEYYIREKQLFLEPGNKKVVKYIEDIVLDIINKYPDLNGIHLDYIRYPAAVPFIPGARFTDHGISYGYNNEALNNFYEKTGIKENEITAQRKNALAWDEFRRNNLTKLIRRLSENIDRDRIKLSCTTVPSVDRSYMVTFQDWQKWLEEDIVDEVFFMNYTDDTRLIKINSGALAIKEFLPKNLVMGLGPYLVAEDPEAFLEMIEHTKDAGFRKIAFFAYDHIKPGTELYETLQKIR